MKNARLIGAQEDISLVHTDRDEFRLFGRSEVSSENDERKGTDMGRPVVHFEIVGRDGEALRRFYGDLFDWTFDVNEQFGYGTVACEENLGEDGVGIGGGVGQAAPPGGDGHLTFYVAVADVEETLSAAERKGAKRLMGPQEISEGLTLGMFRDPEGNVVGVLRGRM
jgi:hypothetical protein